MRWAFWRKKEVTPGTGEWFRQLSKAGVREVVLDFHLATTTAYEAWMTFPLQMMEKGQGMASFVDVVDGLKWYGVLIRREGK